MKSTTTIILCGGTIDHFSMPLGTNVSNAMIPVNGKPVISWILDDLLRKEIKNVAIVLRKEDERLLQFIKRAYDSRMQLTFAETTPGGSILNSLNAGLNVAPAKGLIRVVLGDTLILDKYEGEEDFVFTTQTEESERWCVVKMGDSGDVIDYLDKQAMAGNSFTALAGYYHLKDGILLKECLNMCLKEDKRELSDVLRLYSKEKPIYTKPVREWFDFGHIDTIADAKRRLLRPRDFNSLKVNPILNFITKVSKHEKKLQDEINWYKLLPEELKVLTPRLISMERQNGSVELVQEYYGYPTLAELYVYGEIGESVWRSILHKVLNVAKELSKYKGALPAQAGMEIYWVKTLERIKLAKKKNAIFEDLLARPIIWHNGEKLRGMPLLEENLQTAALHLASTVSPAIIHGDYCFSNILFDIHNQIVRLIDPRGSFGESGIYGDPRYDIAKLRHSVCGLYDFIVNDMFSVELNDGILDSKIFSTSSHCQIAETYDQLIVGQGFNLNEIKLIEGLLFISMLPLHNGHPERQLMMFATGINLLNETL